MTDDNPTTYTISTTDHDEAMLHMMARRMSLLIWEWEELMRKAYKWESGRVHDALGDIEKLRELWYEVKESCGVYEE